MTPPQTLSDVLYNSWPSRWGLGLFVPVAVAALWAARWERLKPRWELFLPLLWLGWQFVAAGATVSAFLTGETLRHFCIAVAIFYAGLLAYDGKERWAVLAGLGLGLCYAMRSALQQHFGGLAATARMLYENPGASGLSPQLLHSQAFLDRMAKQRVFGTFVYPNALAGGLLLLLPLALAYMWELTPKVRRQIRIGFVVVLGLCGLACLFWSGSKAGWLVALVVASVALWRSAAPRQWKLWIIGGVIVAGLAGFVVKYARFFEERQNSVGARFEYWRGACRIIGRHPWLGTGPGTFGLAYRAYRPTGGEQAKLAHDDYLEQATDSGVPGAILFLAMAVAWGRSLYRYSVQMMPFDWVRFCMCLGVFGLALHMLVEFHLYIPALAWPMFFICGALLGGRFNVTVQPKTVVF